MACATLTTKGQVTIPVSVRSAMGLDSGDKVEFVETAPGQFLMMAVNHSVKSLEGVLEKRGAPVSIEAMNAEVVRRGAGGR